MPPKKGMFAMLYLLLFIVCCLIWGFSMPLVLIFAGAFIIYWLRTAKKRRARIMFTHIHTLVASGMPFVVLDHIYFEAALKFALEHGGKLEPGIRPEFANEIDLPMNVEGTNYMIGISRLPSGKTWLGVIDMDEAQRKFQARLGGAAWDISQVDFGDYRFKTGSGGENEKELEVVINEWLELVQDEELTNEFLATMQTGLPVSPSGKTGRMIRLIREISRLTGQDAHSLFNRKGIFKYLERNEFASLDEVPF